MDCVKSFQTLQQLRTQQKVGVIRKYLKETSNKNYTANASNLPRQDNYNDFKYRP